MSHLKLKKQMCGTRKKKGKEKDKKNDHFENELFAFTKISYQ